MTALRIEARNAIGQHRSGPRFSVFIHDNIIRSAPRRWQHPFLDMFGLRVEHADCVAAVFREPEAVLRVYAAAARSRIGNRRAIHGELPSLRIELADVPGGEVQQIEIVLMIGRDAVGTDGLVRGRILERTEVLEFS